MVLNTVYSTVYSKVYCKVYIKVFNLLLIMQEGIVPKQKTSYARHLDVCVEYSKQCNDQYGIQ